MTTMVSAATPTEKEHRIAPFIAAAWDAYEALVQRHNGVYGGCWCMWFHPENDLVRGFDPRRDRKRERVCSGEAHAALVFDGDAIGWCSGRPATGNEGDPVATP